MVNNIHSVDATTRSTSHPEVKNTPKNDHGKFWNASSLTAAEDAYDLDFNVKPNRTGRTDSPQSASSCSCTCDNTCSGCVSTDSGCYGTQSGCYSTQSNCNYGH